MHAAELGCGATTVARNLRRCSIPIRRRGPDPARLDRDRASVQESVPWSPELAWVVGLIATDGNLSKKPYRFAIMSNDVDLLDTVRGCPGLHTPICRHRGGWGDRGHYIAWSDRSLYRGLVGIGLTPAKSLTHGTVLTYIDRYHAAKNERYVYERLYVSLVSASRRFLDWMLVTLRRLMRVRGAIHTQGCTVLSCCR